MCMEQKVCNINLIWKMLITCKPHVGNTDVDVNFSWKRRRCIKFPLGNVEIHNK